MPFDTKPWDKEISIPSLFLISYIAILAYVLGYDLKIIGGITIFFVPFILFLLSNHDYGRKIRTFLSRRAYYNANKKLKSYFKITLDRPLSTLYDKKLDSHMRKEIDKLDLRVVLYSNLALVALLIIFITLSSLFIIFIYKIKIGNTLVIANFGLFLLALVTYKFSIDNCKTSIEEVTDIYIKHIKQGEN